MTERNIVLAGFMGTGKSSVGWEVADQLGRPFHDLDELIATRVRKIHQGNLRTGRRSGFSRLPEAEAGEEFANRTDR